MYKHPTDLAILVGINTYPAMGSLEGAENDVAEFEKWLIDADGGGMDPARIWKVLGSELNQTPPQYAYDAKPTTVDVYAKIRQLKHQIPDAGAYPRKGRRLYLFFSGHGFSPELNETALFMANAAHDALSENVPGFALVNHMLGAGWFEEYILIMDCCRDYISTAMKGVITMSNLSPDPNADPKFAYFYAVPQAAKVPERKIGPNGTMQGVFTTSVLEALRGHKVDSEGRVTKQTMKEYLQGAMRERLGNGTTSRVDGHDIVLVEGVSARKTKVTITLAAAGPAPLQLKDPMLTLLETLPPQTTEFSLELPFGTYVLQYEGAEAYKTFTAYGERCIVEF
ncbi:MAG TPA: caspase family protein [Fimbriimonadaceae bacterium]|nr:caspase family protein [Fimbriimonadaceae bacterium]